MIVFIYGKNSYLRTKKFIETLGFYREKMAGADAARFDFAVSAEVSDLKSFLGNPSIFGDKLFAVIENPFESKEKKELKKIFEGAVADKQSILIIVSEENPPKSFDFLLEETSTSKFFGFPEIKKGEALNKFIAVEAGKRGVKLTQDEIFHLSESFGSDLWGISTELDKISMMDVKLVEKSSAHDFFKTINMLKFGKDAKERLLALEDLLSLHNEESPKIFNMLSFGLSGKEIDLLADYDIAIKSGLLDYDEVLLDFALK